MWSGFWFPPLRWHLSPNQSWVTHSTPPVTFSQSSPYTVSLLWRTNMGPLFNMLCDLCDTSFPFFPFLFSLLLLTADWQKGSTSQDSILRHGFRLPTSSLSSVLISPTKKKKPKNQQQQTQTNKKKKTSWWSPLSKLGLREREREKAEWEGPASTPVLPLTY